MTQRSSINASIGWQQVLPLLGVEANEQSMPMKVACPLCRGRRLTIFDDTKFGGNWHHCPDCGSTGDMIVLASKAWKLSIIQTIRALADAGATIQEVDTTTAAINAYIDRYPGMQAEAQRLAYDACRILHRGDIDVGYILQQTGFPNDQAEQYWPRRMGRFMGAAERKRIYQALLNEPHNDDYRDMKAHMPLNAKDWRNVLTVPFKTLPGQYSGWLFIGRKGQTTTDHAFHILEVSSTRQLIESGVCMFDVLGSDTAYKREFGDTVFVCNDPIYALKLQAKHMRESDLPLPVIGTYNARIKRRSCVRELVSYNIWHTQPSKRFLFWGPTLTPDLFNMASRANGFIYVSRKPLDDIRQRASHEWLLAMQKNAKHWTAVLEASLLDMPEETAIAFLNNLRIPAEQLHNFKRNCAACTQQLLDKNYRAVETLSKACVRGTEIIETDQGWFSKGKRSECVSNAILRLDRILATDDMDFEPIYEGRVICGGASYPFRAPMSELERDPGNWIKRKLLSGDSKFPIIKRGWSPHLLDIARQFHEPEVVREDGRFGWKANESRFSFPQFSLYLGGDIKEQSAHIVDEYAPARNFESPSVTPDIAPLLNKTPSNELFWAATTCLAANVLAPAVGELIAGLGLRGHGAILVGHATARALGCYELHAAGSFSIETSRLADKIDSIVTRHRWPLLIITRVRAPKIAFGAWHNGEYERNVVTNMDDEHAFAAGLLGRWRFVQEERPIEAGPEVRMYGRYVLPLWLHKLCSDKLAVPGDDDYVFRVGHSLCRMMSAYGDTTVIENGLQLIDGGSDTGSNAQYLAKLLYRHIDSGALKFVHVNEIKDRETPALIIVTAENAPPRIFLSKRKLDLVLADKRIVLPDHGKVTDALRNANALDSECDYNGEAGWMINETWLGNQINHCRMSRRLQVIGGAQ